MERRGNKVDIVQRVSCWISDMAFARFKSFSDRVLGIQIDEIPTVESILMRQNFSVVFYAAILFILTNGIYLVKNIAARSMIPIDMVPLYMMIGGSLAMLVFTIAYKKRGGEYDAPPGAVCAAGLLWGGDRQRYPSLWSPATFTGSGCPSPCAICLAIMIGAHIPPCGYRGGMCSDIDQLVAARTASLRGEL